MTQWSHIGIKIKTSSNNNEITLKIHFFNWAIYHQKNGPVFWKKITQILGIDRSRCPSRPIRSLKSGLVAFRIQYGHEDNTLERKK